MHVTCAYMHDSAHVCDEMSGILHVIVSGLHPNIPAFLFECAVARFANDELIRAVACTLSPVPPGLPSIAVHGLELVCVQNLTRGGRGRALLPCASRNPNFHRGHSRRNCAVLVFTGQ